VPESTVAPAPTPSLPAARLLRARHWAWLWVVWFAVLFYLSSLPGDAFDFDPPVDWFDKVEHAAYFLLGGLLLGGWLVSNRSWPHRWWLLPLAAIAVGAFDEWHQKFAPGRSALDPLDWLADVIGGSIALALTHWWAIRFLIPQSSKGD
jgi:VanZ family protein